MNTIRQQQQQLKSSKGNVREKIEQLDASLKSRIAEQKTARSRVPYKNVEEIDRQIERLEKQVDTGTMKLVDEKKALAEVSSLRKQRKGFGQFDQAEKGIADTKAQLTDLRKSLEDPEAKSLSERYTAVAKEWEDVKAQQDEAYKSINSLRDEKTKLQAEQQETYSAIRSIKNKYYAQKKAYSDYEHEAYRARRERQKAQREIIEREKRKKVADQRLEEASRPAYLDQILSAEGLIRFFDKSATNDTTTPTEPSKFAAPALRTIDESDFKGTKVLRKDDREENYFVGGGGKKGKKGKKNGGTASATSGTGAETGAVAGKFNLSVGVIEELGALNIEPPMSQADVPGVVEKLKAKVETWKKDQDRQTKAVRAFPSSCILFDRADLSSSRTSTRLKKKLTGSRRKASTLPLLTLMVPLRTDGNRRPRHPRPMAHRPSRPPHPSTAPAQTLRCRPKAPAQTMIQPPS